MGSTFDNQGEGFADKFKINYGKGSAKTGEGLEEVFTSLAAKMVSAHGGSVVADNQTLKPKLLIS